MPYVSRTLDDGRVQLELTGLKFSMPPALAEKLDKLDAGSATTATELLGDAPAERQQKVAQTLVRMGLFVAAV